MDINFPLLTADQIDVRVATVSEKGCSLLLYKDARCDMSMLDEHVGPLRWKREPFEVKGVLYCRVSIYDDTLEEWVSKSDCGVESYTEKEKGESSDSFKRACVNWGIGRELYTAPFIWVSSDNVRLVDKKGKLSTYDRFAVKKIAYDDKRQISELIIYNDTQKKQCYSWEAGKKGTDKPETERKDPPKLATPDQMAELRTIARDKKVKLPDVLKQLRDDKKIDGTTHKVDGKIVLSAFDVLTTKAHLLGLSKAS